VCVCVCVCVCVIVCVTEYQEFMVVADGSAACVFLGLRIRMLVFAGDDAIRPWLLGDLCGAVKECLRCEHLARPVVVLCFKSCTS
jgi:hypothetical protein